MNDALFIGVVVVIILVIVVVAYEAFKASKKLSGAHGTEQGYGFDGTPPVESYPHTVTITTPGGKTKTVQATATNTYVKWETKNLSGGNEWRSMLSTNDNFRCCNDGYWVCSKGHHGGCGGSSWAPASKCPKLTHEWAESLRLMCPG